MVQLVLSLLLDIGPTYITSSLEEGDLHFENWFEEAT